MEHLKNNPNITFFKVEVRPYKIGYDRAEKVAPYVNLGELWDATKVLNKQLFFDTGIPLDNRCLKAHTHLRELTGSPISIGSAYRSYLWESKKGRSGESQHCLAHAIDLSGEGLVSLIEDAIKTENELYKELRRMGVNGVGLYDWGVHLDFRGIKITGELAFWDERKKKSELIIGWAITLVIGLFLANYLNIKKFNTKKLFKSIRR